MKRVDLIKTIEGFERSFDDWRVAVSFARMIHKPAGGW